MMASYRKLAIANRASPVWVICTREPISGVNEPWIVEDLWAHELTGRAWAEQVEHVWHLEHPGIMVSSNKTGPTTDTKAFTVIGLGQVGGGANPLCLPWADVWTGEEGWEAIWVEGEARNSLEIRRRIEGLQESREAKWEGPLRGLSSTPNCAMVCYKGG